MKRGIIFNKRILNNAFVKCDVAWLKLELLCGLNRVIPMVQVGLSFVYHLQKSNTSIHVANFSIHKCTMVHIGLILERR